MKLAADAEINTVPGRVNYFGMVIGSGIIAIIILSGGVTDLALVLRSGKVGDEVSFSQLAIIFFAALFLCVLMVSIYLVVYRRVRRRPR